MKILYIEDELSKNIPRIVRLFSAFLGKEKTRALQALDIDASGYGADPEEIKNLVEETHFIEVEYRFPDALRKIIQHPERYALFIVDRNLSGHEYTHQEVQRIDNNYNELLYKRYTNNNREGDYLLLKLALFSPVDVMQKFYFLSAYPVQDELQGAEDIGNLIDLGKFTVENFIEKGNETNIERLREIISTTDLSDTSYERLIQQGESHTLEFKSTLRYCLKKKSPQKYIGHAVMKTIAAYLNSEGGTLLIGVDDSGNVLGLEHDFSTFEEENKIDAFLKYFDKLFAGNIGDRFQRHLDVSFPVLNGITICAVVVKERASEGVWLRNKEKKVEQFYIRRSISTIELPPSEAVRYIKEHWG